MFVAQGNTTLAKTTSYKIVLPFYLYAAVSFLLATVLLVFSSAQFLIHYFHPTILAITHTMALGWATMIIIGACHQLVPVLIEGELYSNKLAYATFVLMAIGIPLLVHGFYVFNVGVFTQGGGLLIIFALLLFLYNIGKSITQSKHENIHAIFVFTAIIWLLLTAILGWILLFNFTTMVLPYDSLHYLSLHAHIGIAGWFLLLIIGIASRLIPMFLISKYNNTNLLWWIYACINLGLLLFGVLFFLTAKLIYYAFPILMVSSGIFIFMFYCLRAYQQRIRKQVDAQMKLSVFSVMIMAMPIVFLILLLLLMTYSNVNQIRLATAYGFVLFFVWITSIILGMTFKTLPFIVWNKVYHHRARIGKTPNPKDLFDDNIFKLMSVCYLIASVLLLSGILLSNAILISCGAVGLLCTAILYNYNVFILLKHKPI